MTQALPIIYAPNKIFKAQAEIVKVVDDDIRAIVDQMIKTLYVERAIGLGANMVGILKRIVVVNLQQDNEPSSQVFINPEIIYQSEEKQVFNEASLSFPGISADISRPREIRIKYLDYMGETKELQATGFLASVLQHEIDYLDGKVFLDHLSRLKSEMLLKKMHKHMKLHPPHVHGAGCRH